MQFTSERIMPDYYFGSFTEFMLYLMHIKSYYALKDIVNGNVLDFGCGLGYGTEIIGGFSEKVTGADIDEGAIERAIASIDKSNVTFALLKKHYTHLPFEDSAFDNVVSFQVIEHVKDTKHYLSEISRVLKPGGRFICTTPNAGTRMYPYQKPWNQHHIREYNERQIQQTLGQYFTVESLSGIRMSPAYQKMENRRVWLRKTLLYPMTNIFMPESMRVKSLETLWNIAIGRTAGKSEALAFDADRYIDEIIISESTARCFSFFAVCLKPKH